MAQYRWANGAFVRGDAQVVGERLTELQASNGQRLTPRMVVEDARPPDAALHPCFEWDDLRAAELFREDQARAVIRSVRVITDDAETPRMVRAFVNVTEMIDEDVQHSYVSLARALESEDLRQQLVVQARRDMLAFKERYAEFQGLADVGDQALALIDLLAEATAAA